MNIDKSSGMCDVNNMERNKILKTASIISIIGNAILALSKIIVGIVAGSLAVLGDGLDSLTDIFISLITLFVSIIISHPPDKEHPYGHYRAETLATSVLAFIMFFVGGQLSISTANQLLNHNVFKMPETFAVYVTVFSIVGKIFLSWSQYALGKKSGSSMLIANSKNMQNDVVTSVGVLVGLGCIFFFKLPVIDKILAIIIGLWIMFTAVRIFMSTVTELMEGEINKDLYDKIFEVVKNTDGIANPHRVRIKKLGNQYAIDMDVEVDGKQKVLDAHNRVKLVEKNIRASIPDIYDIVIHIEPLGNFEKDERYGLSEKDMK
jgi:cation diffusion facilitator family transporter